MAQVVELFGAPGTGKSSLVRALAGRTAGGRRLVDARELTRVPRGGPVGRLLPRELTPAERRRTLAAASERWPGLVAHLTTGPLGREVDNATEDRLRPLYAPGWLAATLELRALADAAAADMVVLLDEGLAQRATIACGAQLPEDALRRYVALLPATALHLQVAAGSDEVDAAPAEVDRLTARLTSRGRTIDRHVGRDAAELRAAVVDDLERSGRIMAALRAAGAPVGRVSTAEGPEVAVQQALVLLEGLRG